MGTGSARFGDTCLTFAALLSSDDFFSEIQVMNTSSGPRYIKRSHRVTQFPERLSVGILTWAWKCGGTDPQETEAARPILEKIRLQAGWKTDTQIRPVKEYTTTLRRPSPEEWKRRSAIDILERLGIEDAHPTASGVWIFDLVIRDDHVPLTDTLTVNALSEDGKQIARFTARL
ncbi:MAG: hypothetical protein JWN63_2165 [Candidatus Acidoferrum typicum]|nr:hypothetical protein [Candidatus Acidoferrum typicum]